MLPKITEGEIFQNPTQTVVETPEFVQDEKLALETASKLVRAHKIQEACRILLNQVPLDRALTVFVQEFGDSLQSPQGLFTVYIMIKELLLLRQDALAVQVIQELGLDTNQVFGDLEVADLVHRCAPTAQALDAILHETYNCHFPQMLAYEKVPLWLKTQVLARIAQGDATYFSTTLNRYGSHFSNPRVVQELLRVSPDSLDAFQSYLFSVMDSPSKNNLDGALCSLISASKTPRQFQKLWRRLKKRSLSQPVCDALIRQALNLKLSYEITNIVTRCSGKLSLNIMAKALVAVAWGQKNTAVADDAFTPADKVETSQVSRLLNGLSPSTVDVVLRTAMSQAFLPGRILWSLLLGLERSKYPLDQSPLSIATGREIAQVIDQRPALEQIRYMALNCVPPGAIAQVLRLHVTRLGKGRDHETLSLHTETDVKLVMAGMVIMSEKSSPSTSRTFVKMVDEMFAHWQPEEAARVIQKLRGAISFRPDAAVSVMGLLVKHKKFALAIQILHELGAKKLPRSTLYDLLVAVCRDFPMISLHLTQWMIRVGKIYVPASLLRRMIITLVRTPLITDRQALTRVTRLLKILRGQGVGPGPEAASAIVDSLIKRADEKGRGSRRRLQWALGICREENVPEEQVKQWLLRIQDMRATKRGYFARRLGRP